MSKEKDILSALFESPVKVRALKLFLRNPQESFLIKDAAVRLKISAKALAREVQKFRAVDLVRVHTIRTTHKKGRKNVVTKQELISANQKFPFWLELRGLVLKSTPTVWDKKLDVMRRLGRLKLVVIGGALVNDDKGRIDLLVVGEKLNARSVAAFMRGLEAEVGKELRYMVLTPQEFTYRYHMYDNFLRDLFERPHRKLVNHMKQVVGE